MGEMYADPTTGWLLPVQGGVITQGYGPEHTDPSVRDRYVKGYHTGVDIAGVAEGTAVIAPQDATVVLAGPNGGYGQCVVLDCGNSITALFGHLSRLSVDSGQQVVTGQELGGIGTTGNSTGVHLHYEWRRNGDDIDPTPFLVRATPPTGLRATVVEGLNLREGPNKDTRVLGTAPAGATVTIGRNGWLPVWWDGREGWMFADYLQIDGSGARPSRGRGAAGRPAAGAARRMGRTIANPNLRAGPGEQHPVLAVLPPGVILELLEPDVQNGYLHVRAGTTTGFVHEDFVACDEPGDSPGFLRHRNELAELQLAPGSEGAIGDGMATTDTERMIADTWNRCGGLLDTLCNELAIEPAVAVAVLAIEASGRAFGPDGRMIIRFENHIFWTQWGELHPDLFNEHFRFDPERRWIDHQWRPAPDQPWAGFHSDQAAEWQVFEFARALDDTAAKQSISMGAPQIMGFNCTSIGYESPQAMFDAFSANERAQILGLFDFVRGAVPGSPRLRALRRQDFLTFAALYNGAGQSAEYASLMQNAAEAFLRLRQTRRKGRPAPATATTAPSRRRSGRRS